LSGLPQEPQILYYRFYKAIIAGRQRHANSSLHRRSASIVGLIKTLPSTLRYENHIAAATR
jgi:hypothetical protein